MFEIVICAVKSGRVTRRYFDTWEEAKQYEDRFFDKPNRYGHYRSRRDYRVETNRKLLPAIHKLRRSQKVNKANEAA